MNAGLSDREGRFTFYEVASETTWSTLSAEAAEAFRGRGLEVRPHEIPVTTLARVCEQHADSPIDVLKIDVEYHELEVISGGDWVRWRPRVVLVENNGAECWEPLLLGHGYHHAVTTEINRFYIRDEDRSLLPQFRARSARRIPSSWRENWTTRGWCGARLWLRMRCVPRCGYTDWRPATRGWRPWGRP